LIIDIVVTSFKTKKYFDNLMLCDRTQYLHTSNIISTKVTTDIGRYLKTRY